MDSNPDRAGYHPEWIKYENSLNGPILPPASDPSMGAAFDKLMIEHARSFPPTPENVTSYDEQISSNVKVRVYQPSEPASRDRALPLALWAHGGGWVTGNLDTEDHFCRDICGRADVVVVSVEYRLFPAIRFPQNIEDCVEAYTWASTPLCPKTSCT